MLYVEDVSKMLTGAVFMEKVHKAKDACLYRSLINNPTWGGGGQAGVKIQAIREEQLNQSAELKKKGKKPLKPRNTHLIW